MNKPGVTVTAWVRLSSIPAIGMSILGYAIGPPPAVNSSPRFILQIGASGELVMQARSTDGDTTRIFIGTGAIQVGRWTHVAGTVHYGTSFGRTYLDGEIDNSGQFSANFAAANTSNTVSKSGSIGGDTYGNAPQLNGLVEDVRCYGRALNPSEIQTIFQAYGPDGIVAGLEARYPLTERANGLAVVLAANVGTQGPHANPVNNPLYADTITRSVRRFTRRSR
jgi:hypothetical protein